MQQANLFILPSRFEAFGVVLIEAMATGCPVISTYSGGPEYIVKEHSGILVEPEDPAGLEKAMEHVYDNYSSYDPEKIRQEVVDLYSVAVITQRNARQIISALRLQLEPAFVPRRVLHVETLPRDATGKLSAAALRRFALQTLARPAGKPR
jgi:glycosyltransferase involved in cell wall biosynthesis